MAFHSLRSCLLAILAVGLLALGTTRSANAQEIADLVQQLDQQDGIKRSAAYSALQRKRDPAMIPLLVANLPKFKENYGKYYGVLLLQLLATRDSDKALAKLSSSSDGYVRCLAGSARFVRGDPEGIPGTVKYISDPGVSDADLLMALGHISGARDPRVAKALEGIAASKRNDGIIGSALQTLSYIGGEKSVPAVKDLMKSDRPSVVAMAAAYLHRFGDHAGVDVLAKGITDGSLDLTVLSRVRNLLQMSPEVAEPILEAIVQSLKGSTDSGRITTWAYLLGKLGYRRAIPVLRELVESSNSSVSDAAFDALSKIPGGLEAKSIGSMLESGTNKQRLKAADALRRMDDLRGLDTVIEICRESEADRYEGMRVLAGFRTPKVVPVLIEFLMDSNRNVRMYASNGLQTVLTSLFPYRKIRIQNSYHYDAPGPKRSAGMKAIQAWWERNKNRPW